MRVALLLSILIAVQAAPPSSDKSGDKTAKDVQTPSVQAPGASPQASPAAQPPAVEDKAKKEKPSLSLRASPPISFSPATIHVVGELKGGPDDSEEFYCPGLEWDWGDGTKSEATSDCEPFQAGVSTLQRRFSTDHVYNTSGRFRVMLRLKRNSKVVTSATTNIQVRPGLRDMDPYDR